MVDKNKTTGYVVFALGIILLIVTFYLAIHTYLNPEFIEGFSDLVDVGDEGVGQFVDFLIYIIPVLFLFAMGSVAGKITRYGIKMITSPERKAIEDTRMRKKPVRSEESKIPPDQPEINEKENSEEH